MIIIDVQNHLMVLFENLIYSYDTTNIPHMLQDFLQVLDTFWVFHQGVRPLTHVFVKTGMSWDHFFEQWSLRAGQYFHLQLAGLYPAAVGSLSSQTERKKINVRIMDDIFWKIIPDGIKILSKKTYPKWLLRHFS